jgi:hypothetical protein
VDNPFGTIDELFPEPAIALVRIIHANQEATRIEPWRRRQLVNFITILAVLAGEFKKSYQRKNLGAFGWATRCLLELSIWIDYCNLSNEHAKAFYDDEVRDAYGLSKAMEVYLRAKGKEHDFMQKTKDAVIGHAQSLGISDPYDDFKRVADAAEEVGRKEEFSSTNKMLSKFAHPTAYAINTVVNIKDPVFYEFLREIGTPLIVNSYSKIRDVTISCFPEARGNIKDRV